MSQEIWITIAQIVIPSFVAALIARCQVSVMRGPRWLAWLNAHVDW